MLLIADTGNINGNSSDSPIQLSEQRRENNEGEALIGSNIMFSYYFFCMNQYNISDYVSVEVIFKTKGPMGPHRSSEKQ